MQKEEKKNETKNDENSYHFKQQNKNIKRKTTLLKTKDNKILSNPVIEGI
jgi:hypothetical protein